MNIFLTKDNIARVGDLGLAMKIEPSQEEAHIGKLDAMNIKDEEEKQSEVQMKEQDQRLMEAE